MIEYGIPWRNMGIRPAHGEQQRPAEVLTPGFLEATYLRKRMTTGQIASCNRGPRALVVESPWSELGRRD